MTETSIVIEEPELHKYENGLTKTSIMNSHRRLFET